MVNLITRIVSVETVWRQSREWYFLWRFYGKFNVDIVWGFNGENVVSQITRQRLILP